MDSWKVSTSSDTIWKAPIKFGALQIDTVNGDCESYISYCGRSESVNVIPPAWPSRLENAPFLTGNNENLHEIQVGAGGNEIRDREAYNNTERLEGMLTPPHTVPQQVVQYIFDHTLQNILEPYSTFVSNEGSLYHLS